MKRVAHDLCWIGRCAGCGRTLISATWGTNTNSRKSDEATQLGYYADHPVFCTKRCRAANEHRVPYWASVAIRRAHRKEARHG